MEGSCWESGKESKRDLLKISKGGRTSRTHEKICQSLLKKNCGNSGKKFWPMGDLEKGKKRVALVLQI